MPAPAHLTGKLAAHCAAVHVLAVAGANRVRVVTVEPAALT
jgi:hypothetical protein